MRSFFFLVTKNSRFIYKAGKAALQLARRSPQIGIQQVEHLGVERIVQEERRSVMRGARDDAPPRRNADRFVTFVQPFRVPWRGDRVVTAWTLKIGGEPGPPRRCESSHAAGSSTLTMVKMNDAPEYCYQQAAAIPYRRRSRRFEVMLITTRKGKWIIPKGIVEPELTVRESAAQEALEEAGVVGTVSRRAIGRFEYEKWGGLCQVEVYPLRVDTELAQYDEQDFREREWLTPTEAAARVQLPDVDKMIRELRRFVDVQSPACE